jgi:hypothetical protein
MSEKHNSVITVIGIDIGKNSLDVVGLDGRGAIEMGAETEPQRAHLIQPATVSRLQLGREVLQQDKVLSAHRTRYDKPREIPQV